MCKDLGKCKVITNKISLSLHYDFIAKNIHTQGKVLYTRHKSMFDDIVNMRGFHLSSFIRYYYIIFTSKMVTKIFL